MQNQVSISLIIFSGFIMCTAGCRTYLHDDWVLPSQKMLESAETAGTPHPAHYQYLSYEEVQFEHDMLTTSFTRPVVNTDTFYLYNETWTAENLKVSHFRNGDLIHECTNWEDWVNLYEESDLPAYISVYAFEVNVFGKRVRKEILGNIYNEAAL